MPLNAFGYYAKNCWRFRAAVINTRHKGSMRVPVVLQIFERFNVTRNFTRKIDAWLLDGSQNVWYISLVLRYPVLVPFGVPFAVIQQQPVSCYPRQFTSYSSSWMYRISYRSIPPVFILFRTDMGPFSGRGPTCSRRKSATGRVVTCIAWTVPGYNL